MAVATATKANVTVNVQSRSTVYVANELCRILLETVLLRGLPPDYLHYHQKLLADGFRTWITGRWLKRVVLEVFDPTTDKAVEVFELDMAYESKTSAKEVFKTQIEKLKTEMGRLKQLRPGCQYRVLATTTDDAPKLPGWTSSQLRDTSHLTRQDFGGIIDTAAIDVSMSYLSERSDSKCT